MAFRDFFSSKEQVAQELAEYEVATSPPTSPLRRAFFLLTTMLQYAQNEFLGSGKLA